MRHPGRGRLGRGRDEKKTREKKIDGPTDHAIKRSTRRKERKKKREKKGKQRKERKESGKKEREER